MWIFINLILAAINLTIYIHSENSSWLNLFAGLFTLFVAIALVIKG